MPRWLHITVQSILVITGILSSYNWKSPYPLMVSSALNAIVGIIQQSYNTDGTNQSAPFIPKK